MIKIILVQLQNLTIVKKIGCNLVQFNPELRRHRKNSLNGVFYTLSLNLSNRKNKDADSALNIQLKN